MDTGPRDGRLDTREVRELLARLGQAATEPQLREMVRGVDRDGDGSIDLSEFITMMTEKMRRVNLEGEVRKLFCTFDLDGDGNITCSELSKVTCRVVFIFMYVRTLSDIVAFFSCSLSINMHNKLNELSTQFQLDTCCCS